MNLDMRKVYTDSRFRTTSFKNEHDFNIELPRSFNTPDGWLLILTVIPVTWNTSEKINKHSYFRVSYGGTVRTTSCAFDTKSCDGYHFAAALITNITAEIDGFTPLRLFNCTYDHLENILVVSMADATADAAKNLTPTKLQILTDEPLTYGSPRISDPSTVP